MVDTQILDMYNSGMVKRKPRSDRKHALYMVTNTETGAFYIGLTVLKGGVKKTLKVRWQKHVRRALTEARDWTMCKEIRKYGPEAFVVELVDVVRGRLAAHALERQLITELKPKLNQY